MDDEGAFFGSLIIIALVILIFWGGCASGTHMVTTEAVRAGVAEYTVDKSSGKTKLVFISSTNAIEK